MQTYPCDNHHNKGDYRMALITIRSTEFNMMIDVECDREGMTDAFFLVLATVCLR